MSRLIVVGAGDVGGEVAARWVAQGGEAVGLTRTEDRHAALRVRGVIPSTQAPSIWVRPGDLVLLAVAGSAGQIQVARSVRGLGASRVVMLGTTGLYGTRTGDLGPDTPPGDDERAAAAARAESALHDLDTHTVVLRLGGLWRAGRGPVQAFLRRGSPPPGDPDRLLPLIHRDDAASAAVSALQHARPSPCYVVVMDPLPRRRDFYAEAAAYHGLPEPAFPPAVERPTRYDLAALRRDLLPTPTFNDWRDATR